ncbi:MAG: hypothetical protein QXJ62_03075 [Nitrososphaeria archaeon]
MNEKEKRRNEIGLAVFLITLGVLLILGTVAKWDLAGVIFLPALGLSFIVWSLVSLQPGLLIPGQILLSIGVAVILISKVFVNLTSFQNAAINLMCMGSGWIFMAIASKLIFKKNMNWGYILGAILLSLGIVFLLPEETLWSVLSVFSVLNSLLRYIIPLGLVILGIYIVLEAVNKRN